MRSELLKEFFDTTVETSVESVKGKLSYSSQIKMNEFPGRLWRVDYNDGNGLIKGNINREGKKYYFFPTDKYYSKTMIKPEYGEKWFCSPIEAAEAGWKRPGRY